MAEVHSKDSALHMCPYTALHCFVWHWIAYNYTHGSVRTGHKISAGQDDVCGV